MNPQDLRPGAVVIGLLSEPVKVTSVIVRPDGSIFIVCHDATGLTRTAALSEADIISLVLSEAAPERPRGRIVADGRLIIPLYHGTSSLFLSSILEHGLGGRNVIRELGVIELLGDVVRLCDDGLPPEPQWLLRMDAARRMASQQVTAAGFNFRHGGTYVSPSPVTAARYAMKESGSEIVCRFLMLYRRIEQQRPDLLRALQRDPSALMSFAAHDHVPLLIELSDVPIQSLRTEQGGPVEQILEEIEGFLNDMPDNFPGIVQQHNFELVRAVSRSQFHVHRIMDSWEYGSERLPLAPYDES